VEWAESAFHRPRKGGYVKKNLSISRTSGEGRQGHTVRPQDMRGSNWSGRSAEALPSEKAEGEVARPAIAPPRCRPERANVIGKKVKARLADMASALPTGVEISYRSMTGPTSFYTTIETLKRNAHGREHRRALVCMRVHDATCASAIVAIIMLRFGSDGGSPPCKALGIGFETS